MKSDTFSLLYFSGPDPVQAKILRFGKMLEQLTNGKIPVKLFN